MERIAQQPNNSKIGHSWWHPFTISFVPGKLTPLLDEFTRELLESFRQFGYPVQGRPEESLDVLLTTAIYDQPINWRESLFFTARRRFHLHRSPTVFTIVHITPLQFQELLGRLEIALRHETPDQADFSFSGLTPRSYITIHEQGRRGGSIMGAVRLLQTQTKCVRIILVVGEDHPIEAFTIDLVGGHPRTSATGSESFYPDLMFRIATAVCTREITNHEVEGDPISKQVWESLTTPKSMLKAGREFGARNFFTEMVNVANLVDIPRLDEFISKQYSEGCFATWDPRLGALITTVTGSARPVNKGYLSDNELAVVVSLRPDGTGAQVRQVEGKRNDPPSSEAVEMIMMDSHLPRVNIDYLSNQLSGMAVQSLSEFSVPVTRSKLHGHRGISSYDPSCVEFIPLDKEYYYYPVSCSTEAQARVIEAAFSRSEALTNPLDPRQVVFTILPGHGIVVVEKWIVGKDPFQVIWEFMDSGKLEITNLIPQGLFLFINHLDGKMTLDESSHLY